MKISKIILCGNNGNNAIFLEYDLPGNFTGDVNFTFGQSGFCGAWKYDKNRLVVKENGFNEKISLDFLKNSFNMANNSSI